MKIPCKVVRFTDFRTRNDSKGELAKKNQNIKAQILEIFKFLVCNY